MMYELSLYTTPFGLFFLTFYLDILVAGSTSTLDVQRHLELGRELMAKGQFADALSHLHAAVEGDPENYLTYYRRATAYLALGRSKSALPDLDVVIRLKPDFTAAWIQRGSILLKQGRLDEAHINFETVLRREPDNMEANQLYSLVEPIKRDVEVAHIYKEEGDYFSAISALSRAIEVCPWDPYLREMRSECHVSAGDTTQAIYDLRSITKLLGDSTKAHYRLSLLHYSEMGDAEESLLEIRECLKLDPDHKECFAHYKKVKKLAAQIKAAQDNLNAEQYDACAEKAQSILKVETEVPAYEFTAKSFLCQCLSKAGKPMEALRSCNEAVVIEENVHSLCHRAEARIENEEYEEAIQDYQKALHMDESAQCAQKGIKHAEKLKKQSERRDYYKILGVRRSATKKEIIKAYRKLAQKWHPDSYGDSDEKKMAEKKFIDIAAAKEVLTDPEKRQKFDSGEDPLDPESQAGQGFNPFQGGFHGQPFQFRFHFN